jgi:hypothetical protein
MLAGVLRALQHAAHASGAAVAPTTPITLRPRIPATPRIRRRPILGGTINEYEPAAFWNPTRPEPYGPSQARPSPTVSRPAMPYASALDCIADLPGATPLVLELPDRRVTFPDATRPALETLLSGGTPTVASVSGTAVARRTARTPL